MFVTEKIRSPGHGPNLPRHLFCFAILYLIPDVLSNIEG